MIWVIFYWHRIFRLTPAYLTFILFYATYGPLTDFGPNEIVQRQDMENCKKYGWKNLLYINNIYEPRKNCLSISWYMAADTQMYLVSPLFLIGFLLGPVPGIIISSLVILFSILLNYWLFFHFDLPLTLIQAYMTGDDHIIHVLQDLVYEAAYIRIPPFIFGICMGYMMLKTRNMKIEMNNGPVFCLWINNTVSLYRSNWKVYVITILDSTWKTNLLRLFVSYIDSQRSIQYGKISTSLCGCISYSRLTMISPSNPQIFQYITKVVPSVVAACGFAVIWTLVFEMPFAKLESFFIRTLVANPASEKEKQCTKI
ncbi:Protein CBG26399 [Caenorhabditis briggsae]|uniref:Protein CBG26399 n=1 Tax=Caenorhabditis briggsae TaxID=6238 RepID=B6IFF8_CAEBR|nr:Protein CBG26399 [Caenorhabditis briggsae]CAR98638.1 Protein CBG26399 [Caenorhabditis briggsae]